MSFAALGAEDQRPDTACHLLPMEDIECIVKKQKLHIPLCLQLFDVAYELFSSPLAILKPHTDTLEYMYRALQILFYF